MSTPRKLYNVIQLRKLWWSNTRRVLSSSIPMMGVSLIMAASLSDMMLAEIAQTEPAIRDYLNNHFSVFLSSSIALKVLMMFPFGLVLMVPLVFASNGPYPTIRHVELNRQLRRAAGMSDEVSTETEI